MSDPRSLKEAYEQLQDSRRACADMGAEVSASRRES